MKYSGAQAPLLCCTRALCPSEAVDQYFPSRNRPTIYTFSRLKWLFCFDRLVVMSMSQLLSAGAVVLAFGLWKVAMLLYHRYRSPMRMIPGPKSSHWLYGNLKEVLEAVSGVLL